MTGQKRRRRLAGGAASLCLALLTFHPAAIAMSLQVQADTVFMSGPVTGAEPDQLRAILDRYAIKTAVLGGSNGGNANAGYAVGELIRQFGLATVIRGYCNSSCSRMWLGGVSRTLDGADSRVGLHGNYEHGALEPDAPARLRAWLPRFAPAIDRQLMEQWIILPRNSWMMNFYNDRAELCDHQNCTPVADRNAHNAGLATN